MSMGRRSGRLVRGLIHRFISDERGVALVLMTAGMLSMLGIVGLTLDGGRYYETRRQLQNAVDAAAHAGAQELPDTVAAEAKAQQYWDLNKPSVADDSSIIVTFPDQGTGWADARIQIDVDATVEFSLLSLLGKPEASVGAFAEAGAQVKDIMVILDRSGSMCIQSHDSYSCNEWDRRPSPDGDVTPAWSWEPLRSTQEAAVNFWTIDRTTPRLAFNDCDPWMWSSTAAAPTIIRGSRASRRADTTRSHHQP